MGFIPVLVSVSRLTLYPLTLHVADLFQVCTFKMEVNPTLISLGKTMWQLAGRRCYVAVTCIYQGQSSENIFMMLMEHNIHVYLVGSSTSRIIKFKIQVKLGVALHILYLANTEQNDTLQGSLRQLLYINNIRNFSKTTVLHLF